MSEETWALVRRCERCLAVTAVDLDASEQRQQEIAYPGHRVEIVKRKDAILAWDSKWECACSTVFSILNPPYSPKNETQ